MSISVFRGFLNKTNYLIDSLSVTRCMFSPPSARNVWRAGTIMELFGIKAGVRHAMKNT